MFFVVKHCHSILAISSAELTGNTAMSRSVESFSVVQWIVPGPSERQFVRYGPSYAQRNPHVVRIDSLKNVCRSD